MICGDGFLCFKLDVFNIFAVIYFGFFSSETCLGFALALFEQNTFHVQMFPFLSMIYFCQKGRKKQPCI